MMTTIIKNHKSQEEACLTVNVHRGVVFTYDNGSHNESNVKAHESVQKSSKV